MGRGAATRPQVRGQVSGWLDGQRIRKSYATRGEAEFERDLLEIKTAQGDTGLRKAITRLSPQSLADHLLIVGDE